MIECLEAFALLCSMKPTRFILHIALLFVGVCQMSGETLKPFETDSTYLDELTVSAIKQGVPQMLPVASTVVSPAEVERLGIASVRGISDVVPNFFIPDYGSRMTSSIYVRGIGARIDQPAVGLNVDNVPFFNKDAYDFDLVDIADVEMLRGPQSTLYGRNTMGGLVNITTLSPLKFQGVRGLLEYGRANSLRASASYFVRPVDNFGLSSNIYYTHSDGYFTNEYNGKKVDKENQISGRIKAEWLISPTVHLVNTAAASRLWQGGYPYEYIASGKINYNDTCFYHRSCFNDGLTLRATFPKFTLSSITSAQYIDDNMTLDQDFLPLPYFVLTQKRKEWTFTEDLVARRSTPGLWQWLSGVFAFYRTSRMDAPVTFLDEGIRQLIESHRNDSNPTYPIEWDSRELLLQSHFKSPSYGLAAYHESSFKLGNWHLTAGLRLDYERINLTYNSICHSGYQIYRLENHSLTPYLHIPIDIDDKGRFHTEFLELLPKFAALYELPYEGEANIYASITKGYKAGGYNNQMFSDVLQQRLMGVMGIGPSYDVNDIITYKPEKSWNFEVGSHYLSPNGRLKGEISLFYIMCRDQQLTMFPDGTTTGRVMTNAGKTRSFGGELSLTYSPIRQFSAQIAYGYTNARFTKFFNGRNDYSGKYVPYAPQNTLFVGAIADFPLRSNIFKEVEIAADVTANGPIYWNEENSRRQNFYALLGLSATFSHPKYSVTLWGKNLTATKFDTFYFVSMSNEFLQRGKPVRFGITLRLNINT